MINKQTNPKASILPFILTSFELSFTFYVDSFVSNSEFGFFNHVQHFLAILTLSIKLYINIRNFKYFFSIVNIFILDKPVALNKILPRMKDILTRREVCEYLRVSESFLSKLMKSGQLPYIKFERRVLFRRQDLERLIETKVNEIKISKEVNIKKGHKLKK